MDQVGNLWSVWKFRDEESRREVEGRRVVRRRVEGNGSLHLI